MTKEFSDMIEKKEDKFFQGTSTNPFYLIAYTSEEFQNMKILESWSRWIARIVWIENIVHDATRIQGGFQKTLDQNEARKHDNKDWF